MDSKDRKVQEFLCEIEEIDKEKSAILNSLRDIVLKHYQNTSERMMYGGIMFSLDDDFGGLFVRKQHISFEFTKGFLMEDPKNLLEGKGKYRRHLKIRTVDEIKTKEVEFFVRQIGEIK